MIEKPDNDNNSVGPMVFIIIGKGYEFRWRRGRRPARDAEGRR